MSDDDVAIAALVLRAATQLIEGIQAGVVRRGYSDVRPMHGFAFTRISAGDATVVDLADHLGVTKQAASQLVEQLVQRGYVARAVDPADGRRKVLVLTRRGRACTRAADAAAADVVGAWRARLGARGASELGRLLGPVAGEGPIRPGW